MTQRSAAGRIGRMEPVPEHEPAEFVRVGSVGEIRRLLIEYGLTEGDVDGQVAVRTPPGPGGAGGPEEYLVHQSLLRSQGEFPCAADATALSFCREIADQMRARFGITAAEAVARINQRWSEPGGSGRTPRVWIVGLDVAYHETAEFWARDIYYGPDSRWWIPGASPTPLPPP